MDHLEEAGNLANHAHHLGKAILDLLVGDPDLVPLNWAIVNERF
jgi:hypothetical protein